MFVSACPLRWSHWSVSESMSKSVSLVRSHSWASRLTIVFYLFVSLFFFGYGRRSFCRLHRHQQPSVTVKHLCFYSWHFSEWSRCFLWRGLVRTRSVRCQPPDVDTEGEEFGEGGGEMVNGSVVQSSSLCTVSEKPESLQPCEGSGVLWFTGPWSEVGRKIHWMIGSNVSNSQKFKAIILCWIANKQ